MDLRGIVACNDGAEHTEMENACDLKGSSWRVGAGSCWLTPASGSRLRADRGRDLGSERTAPILVIPAQAGTHGTTVPRCRLWIPDQGRE
ncbi:MAG: hypothetical protein Rubg2KO_38130 [Rubricoccaceae bacterium]